MELSTFFQLNNRAAIAFSAGVDSTYLLYAALQYGAKVSAYYAKSAFQPAFECDAVNRAAKELGVEIRIIPVDILGVREIVCNSEKRCYFCKKELFSALKAAAQKDGYTLLLDGTNFSDDESERPGMCALRELSVRSPLRECGLTKEEIRLRSKQAGLSTWDKPAYACLATRIQCGETITEGKLAITEKAEAYLYARGFRDFRIRMVGNTAKLQLRDADVNRLLAHKAAVAAELKKYYASVVLDLEMRA